MEINLILILILILSLSLPSIPSPTSSPLWAELKTSPTTEGMTDAIDPLLSGSMGIWLLGGKIKTKRESKRRRADRGWVLNHGGCNITLIKTDRSSNALANTIISLTPHTSWAFLSHHPLCFCPSVCSLHRYLPQITSHVKELTPPTLSLCAI